MSKKIVALIFTGAFVLASLGVANAYILSGTVRDFKGVHPDFEGVIDGLQTSIVETTLGLDGKPVYNAGETAPSVTNQASFDQWYRDVAGVNVSQALAITMDNTITADPNVYTYTNSSFFPIDGELFGNEGRSHNYHFTYEINSSFTYQGGETFSFTGDDDLWVFIDDKLEINLGGVHGALSSSVDLDTLGLTLGNDYSFDLFFAERHTSQSNFRIDTSIALVNPVPEPTTMLLFGTGLIGLAGVARRKKK